jgi:hypothetical protein
MNERHRILTTGRGGDFRNLVRDLTNDPRDFPTTSALRAALAEIYPGDQYAAMRETLFDKCVQIAKARKQGTDLLELRGIADEWVYQVEKKLANDDRLLPADEDTDPVDVSAVIGGMESEPEKMARAIGQAAKADELAANLARIRAGNS